MKVARLVALASSALVVACGASTERLAQEQTPVATASSVRLPYIPYASPTGQSVASAGRTACPVVLPPTFQPSSSDRRLALVHLIGATSLAVRDVTDIAHPYTVATISSDNRYGIEFAGPAALSYIEDGVFKRMTLDGNAIQTVAALCDGGYPVTAAWNRDGTRMAYMWERYLPEGSGAFSVFDWHLLGEGQDRVIATVPAWCHCGGERDDNFSDLRLSFSPDGQYISWVANMSIAADFQVRRWDGTLVGREVRSTTSVQNYPTFAAWAGANLYFRDPSGLEAWRDGVVAPVSKGLFWVRPSASPDGSAIAYLQADQNGLHHAFVFDVSSGATRQLSPDGREWVVFLSSGYVWYEGERICTAADQCPLSNVTLSGKSYVYDLTANTETQSVIDQLDDIWPGS